MSSQVEIEVRYRARCEECGWVSDARTLPVYALRDLADHVQESDRAE